MPERDLIKNSNILISSLNDSVRSTGDMLSVSAIKLETYRIDTVIADVDYFDKYTELVSASGNETVLNRTAAISLDGLFVPYTTYMSYSGELPKFEAPSGSAEEPTIRHLNPFNPSNIFGTGVKSTGVTETGVYNSGAWASGGHNILAAMVASSGDTDERMESGTRPASNYFDADYYYRHKTEINDIKSVAHRMPMIGAGWGYSTEGTPVPNSGDNLHPHALWNSSLWKVGPIDVRWDDERKVWSAGSSTKIYLIKLTNTYNPPSFSYEVERSRTRSQYTRSGPNNLIAFSGTAPIYDPEYVAYSGNPSNTGVYEQLDYTGIDYPYYEAFIIRETKDDIGGEYYNIWTEDCNDCGHVSNRCTEYTQHGSASTGKKILIENPLRQNFNAGDLAFSVKTGRKKKVNTGQFTGGSGTAASGNVVINSSGNASFSVTSAGTGYTYGGFAIIPSGNICASVALTFTGGALTSGSVSPSGGFTPSQTYPVRIYPNDATIQTELLDIHWVMKTEAKTVQVNTHVECDGGILQTCSVKLQTEFVTCEWCGEDTALISSF